MNETTKEFDGSNDRSSIYEIGYLLATSLPEEKVAEETDILQKIITDTGAPIIAEEAPRRQRLAYTMRKKTVSGSYDKYEEGYFGWFKFELDPNKIEAIKKAFDIRPAMLRNLVISTVRENTYLGKRASSVAMSFASNREMASAEGVRAPEKTVSSAATASTESKETVETTPASIEDMDKSIDEMVKDAKI